MNHTVASRRIVSRHQPSPEEGGRCCDACGRPWPCDVAVLARELEAANAAVPSAVATAAPRTALSRRASRKRTPLVVAG